MTTETSEIYGLIENASEKQPMTNRERRLALAQIVRSGYSTPEWYKLKMDAIRLDVDLERLETDPIWREAFERRLLALKAATTF